MAARNEVDLTNEVIIKNTFPQFQRLRKSKFQLSNDVANIMYGLGDVFPPNDDSVELLEDLVVKYIRDLCRDAGDVADHMGKMDRNCFLFAVRKDPRKFARGLQLLKANEELKRALRTEIAEQEKFDYKEAEAAALKPPTEK